MSKILTICIILFVFAISICSGLISGQGKDSLNEKLIVQQALKSNESTYKNISGQTWLEYHDDLNYSSMILNDYVKKNISSKEAMLYAVSLHSLVGQTTVNLNSVEPPQKYKSYHNYTLTALLDLHSYLFYLAKFYETNNPRYAVMARHYFNQTLSDQNLAAEERLLHLA